MTVAPIDRAYRIHMVIPIPSGVGVENRSFREYYEPKWGDFMRDVMDVKLSRDQLRSLPGLREVVSDTFSCLEWRHHLESRNSSLFRKMAACHRVFDASDKSLIAYVLAIFGIDVGICEEMRRMSDEETSNDGLRLK